MVMEKGMRIALAFLLAGACAGAQIRLTAPLSVSPRPAYLGDTLTFQATATAGSAPTYSWNFSDGGPAPAPSASGTVRRSFDEAGRYVALIGITAGGHRLDTSLVFTVFPRPKPIAPLATGTILFDARAERIWSVNPDANSVAALDARGMKLLFEVPAGRNPRTLAQGPEGEVWVASQDEGAVLVLDGKDGRMLERIAAPYASRPYGILHDGSSWVYVSLESTGEVLRLDARTHRAAGRLRAVPFPRAMAYDGNTRRLFVARFVSAQDAAEIAEIDAASFTLRGVHRIQGDSLAADTENSGRGIPNFLAGMAISPDGGSLWIAAKKDNVFRGLTRDGQALNFENSVRAMVVRVPLEAGSPRNPHDADHQLDFDNSDSPSALQFGPHGGMVFAALQGSDRVDVLDPLNEGAPLLRLHGVGDAPQGIAWAEAADGTYRRLFVQNFLSRNVSVYDLSRLVRDESIEGMRLTAVRTVAKEPLDAQVLRGKRIFYKAVDSAMSRDGYISCASCHLEGASDLRVWDFTDRGEGLRKTHSLLGRAGMDHGPVHHTANFDEIQDFENDIRGPFGGRGLLSDAHFGAGTRSKPLGDRKAGFSADLDALAAYVASLDRVRPSPHRNPDGSLTTDAKAGEAIFRRTDVGCAACHAPGRFTDSRLDNAGYRLLREKALAVGAAKRAGGLVQVEWPGVVGGARSFVTPQGFVLHDVGTLGRASGSRMGDTLLGLDTPTLKGIWETAPYLHDGSAATLDEVLSSRNTQDRHGRTSHLSRAEIKQLEVYLLQLDDGGPQTARLARPGAPDRRPGGLAVGRTWERVPGWSVGWSCEGAPGAVGADGKTRPVPRDRVPGR